MLPVVAIVGRPNVGKSTLFNRLIGFKKSVVHDRPGVTRDRLYETAEALGRRFLCIDTGGIEPAADSELFAAMRRQVMVAVAEADVIVFLVDGRAGYTVVDNEVADMLRRTSKAIVLAINKLDGAKHDELIADFWPIGIQPMLAISAEHGRGVYELLEAVVERLPPADPGEIEEIGPSEDRPAIDLEAAVEANETVPVLGADQVIPAILVAVIGRPNIGKSTLMNQLLGEERHVVDDLPGTTMDPVDSPLEVDGQKYVLVDTAGVRRKARIEDALERFVSLRSIQAIERCHVCLLMIDGPEGITEQDAKLAQLVVERGRALVVLFNKWDLVKDLPEVTAQSIEDQLGQQLPHVPWAPHLFISAKTGKGVHRILPTVQRVFVEFNKHVSTPVFNRWLEKIVNTHTPPQRHHHPVRLYYGTQIRVRPPTFVIWSNTPEGVVANYTAFLSNQMRQMWGFEGTPLKIQFRKRRTIGEPGE